MSLAFMRIKLVACLQDDDQVLTADERSLAIQEAIKIYSKFRPQELIYDVEGTGSAEYVTPPQFDIYTSTMERIEYPAGQSLPQYLPMGSWFTYRDSTTTSKIRFLTETPQVNNLIRMTYTAPNMANESVCSIPPQDEDCVVNKAAAIGCLWIAGHYSELGEATLNAQASQHTSRAEHWRRQSKMFDCLFYDYLGIDHSHGAGGGSAVPIEGASMTIAYASYMSTGAPRLTH